MVMAAVITGVYASKKLWIIWSRYALITKSKINIKMVCLLHTFWID